MRSLQERLAELLIVDGVGEHRGRVRHLVFPGDAPRGGWHQLHQAGCADRALGGGVELAFLAGQSMKQRRVDALFEQALELRHDAHGHGVVAKRKVAVEGDAATA